MGIAGFVKRHIPNFIHTKIFRIATKFNMLSAPVKSFLSIPIRKKLDKLSFEVHIAEHCNLNCCSCSHFSPLAEAEYLDPEEFRRDAERLAGLFGHECGNIDLMGGEPLLHPEIITFMKIARENFTKGTIKVITNGILLTKMSADFWRACHDYNVGVSVTHYPIKLDEEKIRSLAKEYDINFEWFVSNSVKDFFYLKPIDLSGSGDYRKNFAGCVWSNRCIQLSHGRLYTCMFIPYVRHFNKRFSQNIEVTGKDSVDIYEEGISGDDILQRLTEPVPVCRFCKISDVHGTVKWHVSERKIEEWTGE